MFAIHMCAKNTLSGNARRLYLVCDSSGYPVQAIDEGCMGIGAIQDAGFPGVSVTLILSISNAEYRRVLREYGKR